MNTSKGSLEDRPSILTFPSSFWAISKVDDDAEEESDCEERSKRSV